MVNTQSHCSVCVCAVRRCAECDHPSPLCHGTAVCRAVAASSGYGYGRSDGRNLTVDTAGFSVIQGPPDWLAVVTGVADAWAGGQPFGTQPSVAVVDKGGNIVNSGEYVGCCDRGSTGWEVGGWRFQGCC